MAISDCFQGVSRLGLYTERLLSGCEGQPELGLVVGEPAVFRFLSSTTRRDDPVGTVLDRWNPEEIQELAPLETALAAEEGTQGETVPVRLHSNVNEVGTLELWCQSTRDPRRWKLEFNVREPSQD